MRAPQAANLREAELAVEHFGSLNTGKDAGSRPIPDRACYWKKALDTPSRHDK
jgi:hypothetical protein